MHARRAIVPVVLLAAFAFLTWARHPPSMRSALDDDMLPRPGYTLATAAPPRTIAELRQRIAAILAADGIHGVAIALVGKDGPIWVGGVGVRDRETGAPADGDTMFRVGSLTKSIVALGVMRLVDQGKLDIDRPLREILPDAGIENPWEAIAPVTLAQCMEHTAGLDDIRFNEIFTDDERLSVADTLRLNPRSRKIRWRPGTRHGYSNVGFTLAARAIEVATGEPFDDYLRREILAPMGIVDSDFRRTGVITSRLATGYMNRNLAMPYQLFAHRPSAGLLTSANDLAKLVHFWITRGEGYPPIVSAAALARIERSGTLPYPRMANNYGFANYGDVAHPVMARGHDGGMPGFHSSFRYFPKQGVGYVMLLNAQYAFRGYFQIRSLLYSYLMQDRADAPALAVVPTNATPADRPGSDFFALANPRNEVFGFMERARVGFHVVEADGGLRVDELDRGWSWDLVPAGDGGWRHPSECGSSVRFTTNDGKPVMLMGFLYAEGASRWQAQIRNAAMSFTNHLLLFAPIWAAGVLGFAALLRRRVMPLSLVLWPAVASLSCAALPRLMQHAFFEGVIGIVHPLTVAFCALTIVFAIASAMTLVQSIRWWIRPDRPPLVWRLFPLACGFAFVGFTLWLGTNGWIGLRTWAW